MVLCTMPKLVGKVAEDRILIDGAGVCQPEREGAGGPRRFYGSGRWCTVRSVGVVVISRRSPRWRGGHRERGARPVKQGCVDDEP